MTSRLLVMTSLPLVMTSRLLVMTSLPLVMTSLLLGCVCLCPNTPGSNG